MHEDYRQDVLEILTEMLDGMPDVKVGKSFGYPAFKVGRKIFCFVGGDGISIKLGAARVQELSPSDPAFSVFEVMEGVTWKDWLGVDYADAEDYQQVMPLLQEAQENLHGV